MLQQGSKPIDTTNRQIDTISAHFETSKVQIAQIEDPLPT